MYDVNPLGLTMHLRELDRRAAPKLQSLRLGEQHVSSLTVVGAAMLSLLHALTRLPFFRRRPGGRHRAGRAAASSHQSPTTPRSPDVLTRTLLDQSAVTPGRARELGADYMPSPSVT